MKTGESGYGFKFISEDDLSEYRSVGKRFVHEETGCDLYHVANDSEENFFSFIFRTFPLGNKGTAHIIEHSVLAGSREFPLKDPFIELLKSSMYTFLNAMTYPDKTVYPGASTVEADYFNLMKVYGDAVFFPLLKKETFMQEGIRYEKEGDKIIPRGIVFNEMKGSYSDHNSVLAEWSYRSLFPDNNYKYDSGGMPDEIRKLTYQEFLDFHKIYYHPSNCRIFLYGSIDTEKQLEYIQENFLKSFSEPEIQPREISLQKKINPVSVTKTSHSEEGKGICSITMNWLCGDSTDPVEALEMELLTEILIGSSASPLYLDILKSDIGGDLAPVSGVDTDLRQIIFSVGIRDTSPDREKDFENLIISSLEKAVSEGLDKNLVEGALRSTEFVNREIKGGRPYGLFLMDMTCQGWLHGKDPSHTLGFNRFIKNVRDKINNDDRYFEKLIEEKFLKNSHRSTVVVKPDSGSSSENGKYIPDMDPVQFEEDLKLFEKYRDSRDSEEDIRKIPVLDKKDIPGKVTTIEFTRGRINSSDCYYHDFFTAGIVYADFFYDIRAMDENLKMYLPLFARALRESGLPGIPFYDVARELSLNAGGFFVFPETGKTFDSCINEYIVVRYKAIEERFESASELIFRILGSADFNDLERLKDIVDELKNDYKASILRRGNYVVSLTASKKLSRSLERQAGWAGADQMLFLSEIKTDDRTVLKDIAEKLIKIRNWIINAAPVTAGLTSDKSFFDKSTEILTRYVKNNPLDDCILSEERQSLLSGSDYEALVIPSLVNFNASVIRSSRTGTDEFIHEKLLSRIIDTGFLWEKVRMENGAYGVGATVNGMEGIVSFSSYRDPSIETTQEAFRNSLLHIINGNLTEDELFKAVLNCVGKEIKPLSPGEKGHINMRRLLYRLSDDVRQKNRDRMLKTGMDDIVRAAERLYKSFESVSMATMCGSEALESNREYFSGFSLHETKMPV